MVRPLPRVDCPAQPNLASPGSTGGTDVDGPLFPSTPAPVLLTLCTYEPSMGPRDSRGVATVTWSPPAARVRDGAALIPVLHELAALPHLGEQGLPVCDTALTAEFRLLLTYPDGSSRELAIDRACNVVGAPSGALRRGITDVLTTVETD